MPGITDPAQEYFKDGIWGWDATAEEWLKLPVDSEGRLSVVMPGFALDDMSFVTTEAEEYLSNEQVLGTAVIMAGAAAGIPAAATAGRLYLETDTGKLRRDNGTAWVEITPTPLAHAASHYDGASDELDPSQLGGEPLVYDAYVCVRDVKAQNTQGGTFTSGAWRTRDINDEQADTANICSIASNQITLAAGTYRCIISAPACVVGNHQAILYNVTGGATVLVGTSEYTHTAVIVTTRSFVAGRFTLATQSVLEVEHQCATTRADYGFGTGNNFTTEIYTVAEFWREA